MILTFWAIRFRKRTLPVPNRKSKYHSRALVFLKFSKRNSLSSKKYLRRLWSTIKHFRHWRRVKRNFRRPASPSCSLSHLTNLVTQLLNMHSWWRQRRFITLVPFWCNMAHNKRSYQLFYEVASFSCRVCGHIYETSSKRHWSRSGDLFILNLLDLSP